jgi:type III secretion protein L
MTKLFTLISGKEVRPAPGEKVIEAKDFSVLEKAADLLKMAKKEIEEEAEKARKEAYEEGFEKGLASLNKHLFALDKELKEIREGVQKNILPLALKAARKLLGEELKLNPGRIVDIILTSLKPVTQHRKVIIYVNKADLPEIEKGKSKMRKIFEHLESLSIQERDDIEPGGCMIETEAGIINAQLENQWRALEAAFESFKNK